MSACLFHRVGDSKLHLLLNSGKNAGPPPSFSLVQLDAEATEDLQSATDSSISGIALIPPKPVQKILKGDYVDMHELLPVMW